MDHDNKHQCAYIDNDSNRDKGQLPPHLALWRATNPTLTTTTNQHIPMTNATDKSTACNNQPHLPPSCSTCSTLLGSGTPEVKIDVSGLLLVNCFGFSGA